MTIEGSPRTIFIWTILIATLCMVTTAVTFTGVLHQLGRFAACPGAQAVTFDDSDSGSVDPVGHQGPFRTQVTELHCTFSDGSERIVGNDRLFLYGVGVAAGIGAMLGALIAAINLLRKPKPA
jgi:hypothetical protein